jgi:hypothetical protein
MNDFCAFCAFCGLLAIVTGGGADLIGIELKMAQQQKIQSPVT